MTRMLRTLGVAFVAVLALSAVAASTASAKNEGTITCTAFPCTLTGESAIGNDTFTTEAGTVECKAHFAATLNAASSELTATPTYTGCRAFGFLEATVNMNGCDYLFTTPKHLGTTDSGFTHEWTVTVHVVCPAGKVIEINAATCKATVGAQTPSGHVIITSTTTPTPDDIDVDANVTGIGYTVTQDGFGCPFSGTGAKTGATYTQHNHVTIKATSGGVHLATS